MQFITSLVLALVTSSIVFGSMASAQSASLPRCAADISHSPCATSYDTPPEVVEEPGDLGEGEKKTASVWVLVDTAGSVVRTQIHRSTGSISFDFAAVRRAQDHRFKPAELNGNPVTAWTVLVVTTTAPPSCPSMAVPISAGVALFVDSTVLQPARLGTHYRYESLEGLPMDVFIYPQESWPEPEQQGDEFLQSLGVLQEQEDISSFEVIDKGSYRVQARRGHRDGETEFRGYEVKVRITSAAERGRSHLAVFPWRDQYVKFRVTHRDDSSRDDLIAEFMYQVLSAIASRPEQCP